MGKNLLFSFLIVSVIAMTVSAQDKEHSSEISSSVTELAEFHDVIYPIWHTAYPAKDIEMLREMVPDVDTGAEKIYAAQLPGILRDKKSDWEEGLDKFRSSVERYKNAMEGDDTEEMLNSAEELHANFEMLVRIIRPVTKEVDEFHKVLYMIYHHYLPDNDMEKLNPAIDDLVIKGNALTESELPKRLGEKTEEFKDQSQKLYLSTKKLQELKDRSGNISDLEKAIEEVHSEYVTLEEIFD